MSHPNDRRKHPRIEVKRLVALYHPQFDPRDVLHAQPARKAVAADLSEIGLQVVVRAPLDPGVKVALTLEVPALKKSVSLKGQVVRCTEIPVKPGDEPTWALGVSLTHAGADFHELVDRMRTNPLLRLGGI